MNGVAKPRATASTDKRERFPMQVLPAVLVVYACMLPRELTFEIAGVAFQPFRLVLTLLLPVLLAQAARQHLRTSFVDYLVVFAAIWFFLSLTVTESLDVALVTGLSDGLNLAFAYLAGRVSIRTSKDFQSFVYAIIPGLFFCAVIMAVESITHTHYLRPAVGRLMGTAGLPPAVDLRNGLMRARGPFNHNILAGVFLSSFVPIIWYVVQKPVWRAIGLAGVAGFFFSLASTGVLGFVLGSGLIFTNYLHRLTKAPVFPAVVGAALFAMVFIEVFSGSGVFAFIIRNLTFSPATGYYRIAIWSNAGADVMNHPIFGIGLREYQRPSWMVATSVDAHWLLITLRHGFPLGMAVLVAMVSSAAMSLRGAWSPYGLDQRAGFAIGFSLFAIMVMGLAVYLWEGMGIWMTVLTGIGVSFGQQMKRAAKADGSRPTASPARSAAFAPRFRPRPA